MFYFYMCIAILPACAPVYHMHVRLCTTCMCAAGGGQEREPDPLELDSQTVVSYRVAIWEPNPGPLGEQQVLLTTELSPVPRVMVLKFKSRAKKTKDLVWPEMLGHGPPLSASLPSLDPGGIQGSHTLGSHSMTQPQPALCILFLYGEGAWGPQSSCSHSLQLSRKGV